MPLRHPAVALAKANRLKSLQNSSEVYKAHGEARLSQLTDRPTDRQTKRQNSFENMRMVSKCAFTMSKQTCAKTSASVSNYGLGTFGRSQKPTPPLDRKVPVSQCPVLSSSRGGRHRPSSVRRVLSPCPERERSLRPSRRRSPNHPGLANSRKPQSFQSNACEGLRVVLGSFQVKPL